MEKNYFPYMLFKDNNGNIAKHVGDNTDIGCAYEEALRYKEEYKPIECGIECRTKDLFKIISWKEGRYYRSEGTHLYKFVV